jgi:hypothetical protein
MQAAPAASWLAESNVKTIHERMFALSNAMLSTAKLFADICGK